MTTRDDLVSRLRDIAPDADDMPCTYAVMLEAATALEAANTEIASAQKCCDSYADENQRLSDRITDLERQLAEETERCARSVISQIAAVAKAVGWQAGVGASETAGMIVSCLVANPSEIERFMSEGSGLIVDGTIAAHKGDLTFHRGVDGKVTTPQDLRLSMTVRDMQQSAIRGGAK